MRQSLAAQQRMEDFIWLVNEAPHIIPGRFGTVEELSPAIVYSADEEERHNLYVGNPEGLLSPYAHEGIAEAETPISYRRISAVVVLSSSGVSLAVDRERTKDNGGLEGVQASIGHEVDEVFIGGFSEYPDSNEELKKICTVGLIRQASLYTRLAEINRLDRDQRLFALGMRMSSDANGMPMNDMMAIELARRS